MKRFLKAITALIYGESDPPRFASKLVGSSDVRIRVEMAQPDGRHVPVGELSREGGMFVFRYFPEFARMPGALPLPGFPELQEVYRDEELFPFFAVRLPPIRREDVREALQRKQIGEDDPLRILGFLAKKAISSPYEFELSEAH